MAANERNAKPIPRIDEESKGYWEACGRGELYIQRCRACDTLRHYPRALCPSCLSEQVEWVECSGRGKVYTFTVTFQNQAPGFRDQLPYVLAYVELDEGPRLLTNIVDCDPGSVEIGMAVQVAFDKLEEGIALPKFKPLR